MTSRHRDGKLSIVSQNHYFETLFSRMCLSHPQVRVFNLIDMKLKQLSREKGWPKDKHELADSIKHILENKVSKQWFRDTMGSLPSRWREVIKRYGDMTDYFIPKYQ